MKLNDVLNEIRAKVGEANLIGSCSGPGCRVDMRDIPRERVVVDVDIAFKAHRRTGKKCDRILFYDSPVQDKLVVVLIELKSGTFKATDVSAQLQGSADFAAGLVPKGFNTTCVPVVFHGKGIHMEQRKILRRAKVNFSSQRFSIRLNKCGAPRNLASVLARPGHI